MPALLPILFSLAIVGYGYGVRKWTDRRVFSTILITFGVVLSLITASSFVIMRYSEYINPSLHDVVSGEQHYNTAVKNHSAHDANLAVKSFQKAYRYDQAHYPKNKAELKQDRLTIQRSKKLLLNLAMRHPVY